jgi:excisionase family DNA binding protein
MPAPRDLRPPLTVEQFARRFNLPRSTAYLLVKNDEIQHFRIGRRRLIRIPAAAVDAFEKQAYAAAGVLT